MIAPTCFGITLPSSGRVTSVFWKMLNRGAVDRILWMGVLCLVTLCAERTTSLDTTRWIHVQNADTLQTSSALLLTSLYTTRWIPVQNADTLQTSSALLLTSLYTTRWIPV